MGRRLQISSLDEFSDYLTGDWLEGGPNDVAHRLNLISDYLRFKLMDGQLSDEAKHSTAQRSNDMALAGTLSLTGVV
jgi:hypothetical protein